MTTPRKRKPSVKKKAETKDEALDKPPPRAVKPKPVAERPLVVRQAAIFLGLTAEVFEKRHDEAYAERVVQWRGRPPKQG